MKEDIEAEIRRLHDAGELEAAATVALKGYGPQIFGFLMAMHRDEADASDAFASFSEDLWKGLAGFTWASSFRTWAYTLARHASFRQKKAEKRRGARAAPLSAAGALSGIAEDVRSATLTYMRTEAKSRFAALRDALPAEDRELLVLRVDRKLAWTDLARVMLAEGEAPTEEALQRESARLRKRFQIVKDKLLELGKREGLVGGGGEA